jgi:hypothetical protein
MRLLDPFIVASNFNHQFMEELGKAARVATIVYARTCRTARRYEAIRLDQDIAVDSFPARQRVSQI